MKKLIALTLVVSAVITMSGCKWWPFGSSKKAETVAKVEKDK